MRLLAVGVSHRTAPVELRETVDFARGGIESALTALAARGVGRELVVLSTCNRAEIYAAAEADTARRQRRQRGLDPAAREVHRLAQLHWGGPVADSDSQQPHRQKLWLRVRKYPTGTKLRRTMTKAIAESQAARRPLQPLTRRANSANE